MCLMASMRRAVARVSLASTGCSEKLLLSGAVRVVFGGRRGKPWGGMLRGALGETLAGGWRRAGMSCKMLAWRWELVGNGRVVQGLLAGPVSRRWGGREDRTGDGERQASGDRRGCGGVVWTGCGNPFWFFWATSFR